MRILYGCAATAFVVAFTSAVGFVLGVEPDELLQWTINVMVMVLYILMLADKGKD